MVPAPIQSAGDQGGPRAQGRGIGLVTFAAVVLAWIGTFNVMYGSVTIAHRRAFFTIAHHEFDIVHSWGWIALALGLLQLLAAAGVLLGNQPARWFGVTVTGLAALAQILSIFAHPWWSLAIITVNLTALYGLPPTAAPRTVTICCLKSRLFCPAPITEHGSRINRAIPLVRAWQS